MPVSNNRENEMVSYERRRAGWTWQAIALEASQSQSTVRAQAQRHAQRNGLPSLVAPASERRLLAGREVALRTWQARRNEGIGTVGQWTFGIEIEFKNTQRAEVAVALTRLLGYHVHLFPYHGKTCMTCHETIADGATYNQWKIEEDSSVSQRRGDIYGRGGEVVSPILTVEKMPEIRAIVKEISALGGVADVSCGLHVHIGVAHLSKMQRAKIVTNWGGLQAVNEGFVAPSRRNGMYSRHMSQSTINEYSTMMLRGTSTGTADKMMSLNIKPFSKIGTFEVRLHQGTLNGSKIVHWIHYLLGLFELSASMTDCLGVSDADEMLSILQTKRLIRKQSADYLSRRKTEIGAR